MVVDPGRAIKAARALRGWKQRELADKISEKLGEDVSEDLVSNMESGRKAISTELVAAIAEATELPVEFFIYGPAGWRPSGGSAGIGYFPQTSSDLLDLVAAG